MTAPFAPKIHELPKEMPIFPLRGALLLPRGRLPLNIFEPRYLSMVQDALAMPSRMIGMIQPLEPAEGAEGEPGLYRVGCGGHISSFSETEDGRLLITLTGICRFTIAAELRKRHGYRAVVPDWQEFISDFEEELEADIDRPRLLTALKDYFKHHGIDANWEAIDHTPDDRLVTSLAMICPFEHSEKQALLEASGLHMRTELMTTMIEMALLEPGGDVARH
jgi:Lon protease-like protein